MKSPALAVLLVIVPSIVQAADTLDYDVVFNDSFITSSADTLSVGDRIVINDRLLKDDGEVGRAAGVCTIVDPETGEAICSVTFTLENGSLAVQFVNAPPPRKEFPIIGGTGEFEGRHGKGVLIEHGDGTGSVSFTIN